MPTLDQAARQLGISEKTLRKWMQRLGIERTRHPQDWRYWLITDEQLQQIAEERAKMPGNTPVISSSRQLAFDRRQSDSDTLRAMSPARPHASATRRTHTGGFEGVPLPDGAMGRDHAALLHGLPTATVRLWAARGELETHPGEYGPPGQWRTKQPLTARGVRQLWEKAHTRPDWQDCADCPHRFSL